VAWSHDEEQIAWTGEQVLFITDLKTNRPNTVVYPGPTMGLAWSPDGGEIAVAGEGIKIFDGRSGDQLRGWGTGEDPVIDVLSWSPDGRWLAFGGRDGVVHIRSARSGEETHVYDRHGAMVRALAWSPDSSLLASGGEDGLVHVWGLY
jgi:WD40 repeat protein